MVPLPHQLSWWDFLYGAETFLLGERQPQVGPSALDPLPPAQCPPQLTCNSGSPYPHHGLTNRPSCSPPQLPSRLLIFLKQIHPQNPSLSSFWLVPACPTAPNIQLPSHLLRGGISGDFRSQLSPSVLGAEPLGNRELI